jgi:hypothetical protein
MPEPGAPRRHTKLRRSRTAWRVGLTALVLGAVIVAAGLVFSMASRTPASVPDTAITLPAGESDYQAALKAIASGDTTQATALLAAAANSGNAAAKARLAESTSSGSNPGSAGSSVATDAYAKAVSDIASLLPAVTPGYRLAQVETSIASAIVSAEPTDRTVRLTIRRVEITVFDEHTSAAASAWVNGLSKAFSQSLASVAVGDLTGRFGTDGSHLACVSFSRGRFAFEVVVTVVRGTAAAQKSATVKLAEAVAATHISH